MVPVTEDCFYDQHNFINPAVRSGIQSRLPRVIFSHQLPMEKWPVEIHGETTHLFPTASACHPQLNGKIALGIHFQSPFKGADERSRSRRGCKPRVPLPLLLSPPNGLKHFKARRHIFILMSNLNYIKHVCD